MLDLHIANKNYSSWSLRPWVLMKTLNIPFQEHMHFFDGADNKAKFKAFSPSGTVPCLNDNGIAVWDSLAIIEYLAESYPAIWPSDKGARAWARCATAEMHSSFQALRNKCSLTCGLRVQLNTPNDHALEKDITRLNELWAQGLSQFNGPFLSGKNFTAVDAFFAPIAFRVQTYDLKLSLKSMAYVKHLLEMPAMQDWYKDALNEIERDIVHDEWTLKTGIIMQDLRKKS